jgi:uracil-DNA glycosylase family 4
MGKAKQIQLDALRAQILADKVCPDLAAQATQLVFGAGNPDAEMVFIGEAPGKNEDIQGEPFVGAAGKFLSEMLSTIGLKREDIYITNIVKYRPPNNRDPLPGEKQAFLPYLERQLEVIKPKLIVTLGRHSMDSLLPGLKISEVHGQPKRIKIRLRSKELGVGSKEEKHKSEDIVTWVILPLFHPAAALYNGGLRQTLIDDFALVPSILEKI